MVEILQDNGQLIVRIGAGTPRRGGVIPMSWNAGNATASGSAGGFYYHYDGRLGHQRHSATGTTEWTGLGRSARLAAGTFIRFS